tara:strand:- start:336 stop:530 length:195 start_codon:yes stop_codon:yes gene_type:complete
LIVADFNNLVVKVNEATDDGVISRENFTDNFLVIDSEVGDHIIVVTSVYDFESYRVYSMCRNDE